MKKRSSEKRKISSESHRLIEELYVPAKKNFPQIRVIVRGYDDLWQADIVEMRPYSNFNRGQHYILTIIDVLSKYAWVVPLKSKSENETADAVVEIIRASGRCPKNLQTNMEKDVGSLAVQSYTQKRYVEDVYTQRQLQVDRRAAASRIRLHRTIGMWSTDVTPAIAESLLDTMYSVIKIADPAKFKVGDSVRVYKTIFEKGYTPNCTTEVFTIVKMQRTNPVTYLLEDYRRKSVAGAFYEHKLHRATHPDVYLVEKVLR
ncbi:PREDICTED: uncharacterized protein LOC105144945 [Acromyrmex echinatior]|uniref:uncharacterized protein LOC105144945 n=1 Tax=Acromyrmex echinatior TaxID=103372 RepID=UPI0005810195|nr:PREDICTED: uncharacterized protein LOC105144945 [Acromyrmex echinatior]